MSWTWWMFLGSVFGAIGVGLGAFGAHGLRQQLSPEHLNAFEVGARYHLIHALALCAVALVASHVDGWAVRCAGFCFVFGILAFSGSLYSLGFTSQRWVVYLTPVGGGLFILGWLALAWAARPH